MFGRRRVIRTLGVVVVFLAGCEALVGTLVDRPYREKEAAVGIFLLADLAGGQQMFTGVVSDLSGQLEHALRKFGLTVAVEETGGTVRLRSTTRGGKKFSLVLTRAPNPAKPGVEQTHVAIEWENSADNHRAVQLFAELVLPNDPERAGARK